MGAAGKARAERQNEVFASAYQAPIAVQRMRNIQDLLEGHEGGKFSPAGFELARAANSAGFRIDAKLPNKEAAEALGKQLALDLKNVGGSNQMPGNFSNQDRDFLQQMTPNMAQSNAGRRLIVEAHTRVAERQMLAGQFAQKYLEKYGVLDEGFFRQMTQYNASNPVFSGMAFPK
jgi:hypothetical protein